MQATITERTITQKMFIKLERGVKIFIQNVKEDLRGRFILPVIISMNISVRTLNERRKTLYTNKYQFSFIFAGKQ